MDKWGNGKTVVKRASARKSLTLLSIIKICKDSEHSQHWRPHFPTSPLTHFPFRYSPLASRLLTKAGGIFVFNLRADSRDSRVVQTIGVK
jgi:hypothetical protein